MYNVYTYYTIYVLRLRLQLQTINNINMTSTTITGGICSYYMRYAIHTTSYYLL